MSLSAGVDGAQRLSQTLGGAARDIGRLEHVDAAVGDLILGVVRPPRRSGALGDTIRSEPDAHGVSIVAGSPSVVYAGPIHNGWPRHHIRPQPFLTKAVDSAQERIADKYEDHLTEALSTVKGV